MVLVFFGGGILTPGHRLSGVFKNKKKKKKKKKKNIA